MCVQHVRIRRRRTVSQKPGAACWFGRVCGCLALQRDGIGILPRLPITAPTRIHPLHPCCLSRRIKSKISGGSDWIHLDLPVLYLAGSSVGLDVYNKPEYWSGVVPIVTSSSLRAPVFREVPRLFQYTGFRKERYYDPETMQGVVGDERYWTFLIPYPGRSGFSVWDSGTLISTSTPCSPPHSYCTQTCRVHTRARIVCP